MPIYPTTLTRNRTPRLPLDPSYLPRRDGLVLDWSVPSTATEKTPLVKSARNNEESGSAEIDFTSGVSMIGKGVVDADSIRGRTCDRDSGGVENPHHAKHHPKRHPNLQLKAPIPQVPYLSSVSPGFDCDSSPLLSSTSTPSLTSSIRTVSDVDDGSLDIHWKSLEIAQTRWKGMQDIVDECNDFLSFLTLSPTKPSMSVGGRISTPSNEGDVHPSDQRFVDSASDIALEDCKTHILPQKQVTARDVPSLRMSTAVPTIANHLPSSNSQQPSLGRVSTSSATWSILDLYGDDEDFSKPVSTDAVATVVKDLRLDSQSADILSVLPQSSEHGNRSLRKHSSISTVPSFALNVPFPDAATLAQRKRKSSAPVSRYPVSSSIASPSSPSVSSYSQNDSSELSSSAIRPRDSLARIPVHRKGPLSNTAGANPAAVSYVKSPSSSSFKSTMFKPLSDVATMAKSWSGKRKSLNTELESSSFHEKISSTNMIRPEPSLPLPMVTSSKTDSICTLKTTVATLPQKGNSNPESSSMTKRRSILKPSSQVVVPPTEDSRRPGRVRAFSDAQPMVSVPILSPGRSPPSRRKSGMFKSTSSRLKNIPTPHSPDSSTRDNLGHSRSLRIPEGSLSIADSPTTLTSSTKSSITSSGRRHTHTHFIDANAVPFPHRSVLAQRIIRSPPPPSMAEHNLLPSSPNYVPSQDRASVTSSSMGSETRSRLSLSPPASTIRNHSSENLVGTGSRGISARISASPKTYPYVAARASVSTGAF